MTDPLKCVKCQCEVFEAVDVVPGVTQPSPLLVRHDGQIWCPKCLGEHGIIPNRWGTLSVKPAKPSGGRR